MIAQEAAQYCGENIVLHHMRMYNFSFGIYMQHDSLQCYGNSNILHYTVKTFIFSPVSAAMCFNNNVQVVGSSGGDLTPTGTELMTNVPIPILV